MEELNLVQHIYICVAIIVFAIGWLGRRVLLIGRATREGLDNVFNVVNDLRSDLQSMVRVMDDQVHVSMMNIEDNVRYIEEHLKKVRSTSNWNE